MGVTDASLDGYLSANLSSVAGGVGAGILPCADVTQCGTYLVCPTST